MHILVVEDEERIALLHRDYLQASNFDVSILDDGGPVVEWVKQNKPDLIVLDLMLPNKDGLQICQEIRQFSNVPIIMVTAKVDEVERLIGLEGGADDYVCKPFSAKEVVARVKAVLRRHEPVAYDHLQKMYRMDEEKQQLFVNGKHVDLTTVEFQLFKRLADEPGNIHSRAMLMQSIYSDHRIVSERTIDSHIKKIRKKLIQTDAAADCIQSVYGAGYKFELAESL